MRMLVLRFVQRWRWSWSLLSLFALAACATPRPGFDAPKICSSCEEWNQPQAPFRIFGNSYYVGPAGLGSVLIDTGAGLVLLDGGLPQSAARIVANLRTLGFRIEEVRWIGCSHAHYDHVGGVAALQRQSGARVYASPRAAAVLRIGNVLPDDPQAGLGALAMRFPAVAKVVEVGDGESLVLGGVRLTAHHVPGHTAGGTTWSWQSCAGERCLNLVYADSLNPVSAPGFRYSAEPARVAAFRASIDKVRRLPCDILVAVHPGFTGLFERIADRQKDPTRDPLIDPMSCVAYADAADRLLDRRLQEEAREIAAPK